MPQFKVYYKRADDTESTLPLRVLTVTADTREHVPERVAEQDPEAVRICLVTDF